MSSSETARPLSLHHPKQATEAFADYRNIERERRRNSGEEFDPALFEEAAELVMRKLQELEEKGLA